MIGYKVVLKRTLKVEVISILLDVEKLRYGQGLPSGIIPSSRIFSHGGPNIF